jgi:hypothetical protein
MDFFYGSAIHEWVFIFIIAVFFYILRNFLFKKYKIESYLFLLISTLSFGTGCFYFGKSIDKFFESITLCGYKQEALTCFILKYLSMFPEFFITFGGLAYLLAAVESMKPVVDVKE